VGTGGVGLTDHGVPVCGAAGGLVADTDHGCPTAIEAVNIQKPAISQA